MDSVRAERSGESLNSSDIRHQTSDILYDSFAMANVWRVIHLRGIDPDPHPLPAIHGIVCYGWPGAARAGANETDRTLGDCKHLVANGQCLIRTSKRTDSFVCEAASATAHRRDCGEAKRGQARARRPGDYAISQAIGLSVSMEKAAGH